ncbi:MAG: tyrosine-type recombinase/integrase [Microbacteriaceae bacterium]
MVNTISAPDTWVNLIAQWLDALRAEGLSQGSIKLRSYQIRRFSRWFFVEHANDNPLDAGIDTFQEWLSTDGWSPSTKKSARAALRSFYQWLVYSGRLSEDPTKQLKAIRVPVGSPRPAGELAVRSAMKSDDPRVPLMVRLASVQGLRAVEIARVHTDDVFEDLVGWSLRVHGKGGKVRVIPLDEALAYELRNREQGFIFPGRIDGHLSASYVSKLLSRALPLGITGHMLRHRAAGKFYQGTGYDLRATQELLGHASPATTQIYTPAIPDQMRLGILAAAS